MKLLLVLATCTSINHVSLQIRICLKKLKPFFSKQDEKTNGVSRAPQPRVVPPPPKKPQNDYLGDIDLPSSSSEDEGETERYTPIYAADDKDNELKSMVRCLLSTCHSPCMRSRRIVHVAEPNK